MLQGIATIVGSIPMANIACVATGLFIGRNFCAAAAYKTGSILAKVVASKKAVEWNQASDEYLTLAKKNGIRDLTAAAGFIAIGLASGRTEEKVSQKEESISPELAAAISLMVFIAGNIGVCGGVGIAWYIAEDSAFKRLERKLNLQK